MYRLTPALLPLLLVTMACVPSARLEEANTELSVCEDSLAKAKGAVQAWEQRFDRESQRWENMEASVSEALPAALTELAEERERVVEMLPEQVRSEVNAYLEEYSRTVAKGFRLLREDNEAIRLQLDTTFRTLEALGTDTRNIGQVLEQDLAQAQAKHEAALADRQAVVEHHASTGDRLRRHMSQLVSQLADFDRQHLHCKNCPERLRLNRKERDTLVAFHGRLVEELSTAQSLIGSAPPPAPAAPAATPVDLPSQGDAE